MYKNKTITKHATDMTSNIPGKILGETIKVFQTVYILETTHAYNLPYLMIIPKFSEVAQLSRLLLMNKQTED